MSPHRLLALTFVFMIGPAAFATPADAQSCEQELARQDAALRQFDADARREGLDFVLDDARHAALGEVSKRLRGDATADAAQAIKARWEEYQAYVNQGRTLQSVAEKLSQCFRDGRSGCLSEIKLAAQREMEATRLSARIGEAVLKWIESLGNETMSRAVEQVDRARSILQNFTNRAGGTATEAATRGIDSCLRDFDRRVQQAQADRPPVDPRQPAPPGPSAAPKRGMSAGKLAALVGIPAAVAVVAGTAAKGVIDDATAAAGGNSSNSSSPSQIRLMNNPTIRCSRSGGTQSVCKADIVLDVANVFGAGTQVCIRTDPSAFFTCVVRGSSSQLLFSIDQQIVNVDLSGNISGCRPLQTGIWVYDGPATGIPATARVSANIPVTCN